MLNKSTYPVSWNMIKLGDIADFKNGLNYRAGENKFSYHILSVASFQNNSVIRNISNLPNVDLDQPLEEGYRLVDRDLVFVRSNGNPDLVGRCVMVFPGNVPTTFSGFTIRARIVKNQIVTSEWVHICLRAGLLKKSLKREGAGTNITNLNQQILSSVLIPIPSMKEQKAIADILIIWDEAIEKTERLIELKRVNKRQLISNLLDGRNWDIKSIDEIGGIQSVGVDKKNDSNENSVRLLNYLDVYRNNFISNELVRFPTTASERQIQNCNILKGDIFFTPSSETRKDISHSAVATEDLPGCVYSYHIVRLRLEENWPLEYRAYAFKSGLFYRQAYRLCDGSGQRYVLSLKNFRKMQIHNPPYEEQIKIGTLLSLCDQDINNLIFISKNTKNKNED